jgi:hypothetical protein
MQKRKSPRLRPLLAVGAACAAVATIGSLAAHATSWDNSTSNDNTANETAITVRLDVRFLFDRWNVGIPPGQTGTTTQIWVQVNKMQRIERIANTSVEHALKSTNCTGVYGVSSNYKITGDANGVVCTKK